MSEDKNWDSTPPEEITLSSDKDTLGVLFSEQENYKFSAEFLRVMSPSAEVKGHGSEPMKIVGGKKNVRIVDIQPIGNYAVKLVFDDGHDTGIYSWSYLREHGENQERLWNNYLDELAKKNLNRHP